MAAQNSQEYQYNYTYSSEDDDETFYKIQKEEEKETPGQEGIFCIRLSLYINDCNHCM